MANGIVLNIDTTKSEFQNPMVELRQGDGNYQSLHVTVTNNGDPFDLTGWTITFMGTTAGAHKIVDANAVVDNALQGTFNYTPTKAWGQDIGEFSKAYFKFTKDDEAASGANFRVNVLDAVDLTAEEAQNYISVVDVMIDQVKNDMDTKLVETKQTLADTQSQANTVQTNVNDLNTNVNDLKAQNNNIKTSDNYWTGINTFTKPIDGSFSVKEIDVTDFVEITLNTFKYAGIWSVNGKTLLNQPIGDVLYGIIEVKPAYNKFSGTIIYRDIPSWRQAGDYIIDFEGGVSGTFNWRKIANDAAVVHNTGTETVAGDKTFTGNNSFTQNIQGNITGNSGTTTKLQTPRKINGTNFDGTDDININAANDSNLVHLAGNETVAGDKTFTGVTDIHNQKQYNSSFTIGTNTFNLTRIGSVVYVNAKTVATINSGSSYGTIPGGFTPSNDSVINFIRGSDQGSCLFQATQKNVWFPVVANTDAGFSGSYLTSDAFPTN